MVEGEGGARGVVSAVSKSRAGLDNDAIFLFHCHVITAPLGCRGNKIISSSTEHWSRKESKEEEDD